MSQDLNMRQLPNTRWALTGPDNRVVVCDNKPAANALQIQWRILHGLDIETGQPQTMDEDTMKQWEYVHKHKGQRCPNCKGEALEGEHVNIEQPFARQEMLCLDCDTSWTDVYALSHIVDVSVPDDATLQEEKTE